jgi:hypothetical protein
VNFSNSQLSNWTADGNAGNLFGTETGRSDRWALPAFVNRQVPTGANLHLAGNDTVAVDHGTPVSAFNVDIDGDSRPQGAAWDIGADEVKSGTSQPPAPALLSVEPVP